MSRKVGVLYDNISGNIGDQAIGLSVRRMLASIGADFEELVPGRFNPEDYQTIIVGGGHLLRPSPDFFYDKFRVQGSNILNCCGIVGFPEDLEYLNDYLYVTVRSEGDKGKVSYLSKEVKVVPCTSMLLNDLPDLRVDIQKPSLGVQLWAGLIDEESLIQFLSSQPFHIYFLPITHYNHDFRYLANLSQRVNNSSLLPVLRPEEIFTLIGKFDYFVSASLHGAIFSYVHGVPFLLFDTGDDKMTFFLEERGLSEYLFRSFAELRSAFERLQDSRPDYSSSFDEDLKTLKKHKDTIRDILSAKHFVTTRGTKSAKLWTEPDNLGAKLQERNFQIHYLQKQVEAFDAQARELQTSLEEKTAQAQELQTSLEEKTAQAQELQTSLEEKYTEISALGGELASIKQSLIWRATMKFQSLVDRLLPLGTRRRGLFELGLAAIRVIINEGWRSFWVKGKRWLGSSTKS